MSYGIMRIEKIKGYHALAEREKHNLRKKTVLGANGSKDIEVLGRTGLVEYIKKLEEEMNIKNKRKTRKDAIRAIEVLFTSDRTFFEKNNDNEYFNECIKWLADIFGESNIQLICKHNDESTKHLHCILTTIKDGKFNYSAFIDGRQDLRKLQDSFYEKVGKKFGLERGAKVEITGAVHKSNNEWNKNVSTIRSYAAALDESKRLDYAIKGVLADEEIKKYKFKIDGLLIENQRLKEENKTISKRYMGLKRGLKEIARGKESDINKLEYKGIELNTADEKKEIVIEDKMIPDIELYK